MMLHDRLSDSLDSRLQVTNNFHGGAPPSSLHKISDQLFSYGKTDVRCLWLSFSLPCVTFVVTLNLKTAARWQSLEDIAKSSD